MNRQTIGEWLKRYKTTGDYGSKQHLNKGRKIIFNAKKRVNHLVCVSSKIYAPINLV